MLIEHLQRVNLDLERVQGSKTSHLALVAIPPVVVQPRIASVAMEVNLQTVAQLVAANLVPNLVGKTMARLIPPEPKRRKATIQKTTPEISPRQLVKKSQRKSHLDPG